MNYYVLQVAPREEEKAETHIRSVLSSDACGECFHLTRLMRKKFHGCWTDVREKLLPGYVFVTTDNPAELYLQLKKIPLLTRLLGRELEYFIRLSEPEQKWLENLLGQDGGRITQGEVGLSQIAIREGNEVRIVSGPLARMEGLVRKINLHKMIAEVEVPFMGGRTVVYLGVEMVERK